MRHFLLVFILSATNFGFAQTTLKSIEEIENCTSPESVISVWIADYSKQERKTLRLPDKLAQFSNLKRITVENYDLEDFDFTQVPSLEMLSLKNCNLNTIPNSVFKCNLLYSLSVPDNHITEIPSKISALKNLKTIDLSDNKILNIHNNISKLKKLTRLDLGENKLEKVPSIIYDISSLEVLVLGKNPIEKISHKIMRLTLLKSIYLHNTKISNLPTEIRHCKFLTMIFVKDTPLAKNEIRRKVLENAIHKKIQIYSTF